MQRAAFLDRDGVLNTAIVRDGQPYPPQSLDELRFEPGAKESVGLLRDAGFRTICVTNQPDVARGTLAADVATEINRRVVDELGLDDLIACFHDNADRCDCRKPLPGMLVEGGRRWGVDLAESYMVGDRWRDVDAGKAAGCKTVLIDRDWRERAAEAKPNARVVSIVEAARWILTDSGAR